jgi:hydrogenase nickel incorporation protein HypB
MTTIGLERKILSRNDREAAAVRRRFAGQGTYAVNLISSPGSGKTSLLEASIAELRPVFRIASLVGDVATELDAQRLMAAGAPSRQILTTGACHLDARQIHASLEDPDLQGLDLLFIENVGNLICPTSWDLGEDAKVALLSVAEGDDKPFKYPAIFSRAAVTIITKCDLIPHVRFDLDRVRTQLATLNPEGTIIVMSTITGEGLGAWYAYLTARIAGKRLRPLTARQRV